MSQFEGDPIISPDNECVGQNGGCEHTCIDSPYSYSCQCDNGYILNSDGKNCDGMQTHAHKHTHSLSLSLSHTVAHTGTCIYIILIHV